MSTNPDATGSCLCGNVTFAVTGAFAHFFLCHCARCRKDTGSAHAANLFAPGARLDWLSGADRVRHWQLPATRHRKSFCDTCGSALPDLQFDGALLVVPAGSLDTPVPLRPDAHICCDSRADWDRDLHDVPEIAGLPG